MSINSCNRYEAAEESEFPSLTDSFRQKLKEQRTDKKTKLVKTYDNQQNHTISHANVNTRMCISVVKGFVCKYKKECRFAHSLDELVIRNCPFKDNCRLIKFNKNSKIINVGSMTCMNKHPGENQDEFIERTGLSIYKTKHKEIEVDDEEVDDEEVKEEEEVKSFVCDRQTNYNSAAAFKATLKPLPTRLRDPSEKEIVIRVPKELAMQAFELTMNSGNRCIRVEIIE